jgi:hypothetical protein
MTRPWRTTGLLLAVGALTAFQSAAAQTTRMPSTLRFGSGYLDVPVASVLGHRTVTGTFSGFRVSVAETAFTRAQTDWFLDGSVAVGLFDRIELGGTLQSLGDAEAGGNMWGGFGRVALLRPREQGIGLAGGVQWVSAPSYATPDVDHQPPRLGYPDQRFFDQGNGVQTELTLYGVTSLFLRGPGSGLIPDYDLTLTTGYGSGVFAEGRELGFYSFASSAGWFLGGAAHVQVSERATLHLMSEWNGFDVNVGTQLHVAGVRVGAHLLGANYWAEAGAYRSAKLGFLVSTCLDLSGTGSLRCGAALMPRVSPEMLLLPAPPPDTVMLTREVRVEVPVAPTLPTGTPASLCLATGANVSVLVTAQGDTLVGAERVSIRALRPEIVFAGDYAQERDWFMSERALALDPTRDAVFGKLGSEVRLECSSIERVGAFMGVSVFAVRNAERPFRTLYLPVRPGVWQGYQLIARGDE